MQTWLRTTNTILILIPHKTESIFNVVLFCILTYLRLIPAVIRLLIKLGSHFTLILLTICNKEEAHVDAISRKTASLILSDNAA